MGAAKRVYTARAEGRPIPAEVLRAFAPKPRDWTQTSTGYWWHQPTGLEVLPCRGGYRISGARGLANLGPDGKPFPSAHDAMVFAEAIAPRVQEERRRAWAESRGVEVEAPKPEPEPAPKPATRQRWQKTSEGRYALGSTGYRVTYCGGPTEPRPWFVTRPDGSRLYDASGRTFAVLLDAQEAAERAASGQAETAPTPKPAPAKDLPGQGLLF